MDSTVLQTSGASIDSLYKGNSIIIVSLGMIGPNNLVLVVNRQPVSRDRRITATFSQNSNLITNYAQYDGCNVIPINAQVKDAKKKRIINQSINQPRLL